MDDLIDIPVKENEYKIIRFANFLRGVFAQVTVDTSTLRHAARALGHLARAGGPMTADFVEFEVRCHPALLQFAVPPYTRPRRQRHLHRGARTNLTSLWVCTRLTWVGFGECARVCVVPT